MYHTIYAIVASYLRRYTEAVFFTLLSLSVSPVLSAAPLTLDNAWKTAEQNNPAIQRLLAGKEATQGELNDANAALYNNPIVNLEGRRRSVYPPNRSDANKNEWGGGVAQTFEIAGQQGLRRQSAQASLATFKR